MDIRVSRVVNRHRTSFLVLEVKCASYANSNNGLPRAEDQLINYLNALVGSSRIQVNQLWGALCIGKSVQFYGVKKVGDVLEMLRIDRQPETVVGYPQYIKSSAT